MHKKGWPSDKPSVNIYWDTMAPGKGSLSLDKQINFYVPPGENFVATSGIYDIVDKGAVWDVGLHIAFDNGEKFYEVHGRVDVDKRQPGAE